MKTAKEAAEELVRVEERGVECVCLPHEYQAPTHPAGACPEGVETAEVYVGDISLGQNLAEEAEADCARIRTAIETALLDFAGAARREAIEECARACDDAASTRGKWARGSALETATEAAANLAARIRSLLPEVELEAAHKERARGR